jgi:hypothetical protein
MYTYRIDPSRTVHLKERAPRPVRSVKTAEGARVLGLDGPGKAGPMLDLVPTPGRALAALWALSGSRDSFQPNVAPQKVCLLPAIRERGEVAK